MCFEDKSKSRQTLLHLLNCGKSIPEISSITGLKKSNLIMYLKSVLLSKIREYLIQDLSAKDISSKLGLGESTVRRWINKNDLVKYWQNRHVFNVESWAEGNKFIREFVKGYGLIELSIKFKIHNRIGKKLLLSHGFKIFHGSTINKLNKALKGESYVKLSNYTKEVITGSLLGDGYIEPVFNKEKIPYFSISSMTDLNEALNVIKDLKYLSPKPNWRSIANKYNEALEAIENHPTARFGLSKSVLETKWVRRVRNILRNNGLKTYITKGIDKKQNKHTLILRHNSIHQLFEERRRWYKNGVKILPKDLKITPVVVQHWFAGDGSLTKGNSIIFCTDNFSKKETYDLTNKLNKEVGINSIVSKRIKSGNPDINYWRIGVYKQNDVQKVFDYMEQGDARAYHVLKETMPWKFDPDLRKKDELTEKVYSERIKEATKLAQEKT